jgi:hypothetical protein
MVAENKEKPTKECIFWKKRACKRPKCRFLHSEGYGGFAKKKECWFWRHKDCKYGAKCWNVHLQHRRKPPKQEKSPTQPAEVSRGQDLFDNLVKEVQGLKARIADLEADLIEVKGEGAGGGTKSENLKEVGRWRQEEEEQI